MKVIIAAGDPAGCGPAISLAAINKLKKRKVDFFIAGDKKILAKVPSYQRIKKRLKLIDLNTPGIERIKKGYPSSLGGKASLAYLKAALDAMKAFRISRLVTAPLSKEAVKKVSPRFSGHTEYLAGYFKARNIAMVMVSKNLRVALFSRHIPLRKVTCSLNKKELSSVIALIRSSLMRLFKVNEPKIVLTSLNPHAGVDTFLGKEEKKMAEVARRFKKGVYGPYPADTVFIKDNLKKYHCVLSFYHDQAMIPFKLLSFREGVNLTLGLPIIRTSPAHGVAYQCLREKKSPFSSSMEAAIKLALRLPGRGY